VRRKIKRALPDECHILMVPLQLKETVPYAEFPLHSATKSSPAQALCRNDSSSIHKVSFMAVVHLLHATIED
jgi:hypothetical protein